MIEIETNLNVVIPQFERRINSLPERIERIMNEVLEETLSYAIDLAETSLPSGGGSYIAHFKTRPARRYGNEIIASLINDHPWAQAVERGGGPTTPHGKAFAIPPGRSPYMVKRVFSRRAVPRAFFIISQAGSYARRLLRHRMRRLRF